MNEKKILRPQFDGRKRLWKIAQKTNTGAGGWATFPESNWYVSLESCENGIDVFIYLHPELYEREP